MLNTLRSFTPTALANTCTDRIASAILVLNSTNSTVGSFKLFICLIYFANTFCRSTAVRIGLHNASVSLSRNNASVRSSGNIPRSMSALLAML